MIRKSYGTEDIARICSATRPTVGSWIKKGKIPFFTTPGGHKRVWEKDLFDFLKTYNISIPTELQGSKMLRVLIVEDESDVLRFVSRVVKSLYPKAEIHEATNGFEAGHKAASLKPSLMILDLYLPGMNGLDVCQMIRRDKESAGIKILAISGVQVEKNERRALDAGADDFLSKPFHMKDLAQKIKRLIPVLEGKRA